MSDLMAHTAADDIAALEDEIADLAERRERCSKLMLIARIAIAAGAAVLALFLIGWLGTQAVIPITGFAFIFGGLTMLGANRGSLDEAVRRLAAAEARRAALIDRLALHAAPVPGGMAARPAITAARNVKDY